MSDKIKDDEISKLKKQNEVLKNEIVFLRELSDNLMERLYAVMNNSYQTVIMFLRKNFFLEHVNAGFSNLLGYSEEFFDSEIHKSNMVIMQRVLEEKLGEHSDEVRGFTAEIVLKNIKGKKLTFQFHVSKMLTPLNEEKGFLFVGNDITLEKKMKVKLEHHNKELVSKNKKIEEANRYKTEFLNNITHELRTPLSGIIGVLKLIRSLGIDNDNLFRNLDIIESNSKNLLSIIKQLLDISRIEAGRMTVSYSKIPLMMIVYDAETLASSLLSDKPKVKFSKTIENPEKLIYFDHGKVRQILTNLIGNAVKFTAEGEISFFIAVENDRLIIRLTDTGIGIKKEDQEKIFHPFIQADGSITRSYGGTGLGLTITKKLVKLLDGTIKLKSEFGKGTEFKLSFKLSEIKK